MHTLYTALSPLIKWPLILFLVAIVSSCIDNQKESSGLNSGNESDKIGQVRWQVVDSIDYEYINSDLVAGRPTLDIGVYFPSNLDPGFKKVTMAQMLTSILASKEIYAPTGVQINLLWIKSGEVNPNYFSIQANQVPGIPQTEYVNMYQHNKRHPAELTPHALNAFEHIIEPDENNDQTVYFVVLQDVFYPFLEVAEGRNWTMKSVRTGGLSFPTYSYVNTIPKAYRGVITITNLSRPDRTRGTVAHEIGHKVMNVSHEYKDTNPGHEIFAEGGLMLYGDGEDIPAGKEGRWHQERLLLSPFLYRVDEDGKKLWNNDYLEGGHYYDPIYGDKVVYFDGKPEIDEDW